MADRITERCSSLDRAMACPASRVPAEVVIETDDAAARLGSAFHQAIAGIVKKTGCGPLRLIAEKWRVEEDELEMLVAFGRQCWKQLSPHFQTPVVEEQLHGDIEDVFITGKPDIFDLIGNEIRLLDWKSGHGEYDHDEQVRGYAWLLLAIYPDATHVRVMIVRVRDRSADAIVYTREEIESWGRRMAARIRQTEIYNPGDACTFCPRAATCPAKTAMIQQSARALDSMPSTTALSKLTGDQLFALLERAKDVEEFAQTAKAIVKAEVASRGGSVEVSDGKELRITRGEKRTIDTPKGWPILLQELGLDRLLGCVKVSKTAVMDAVRDKAISGKGRAADEVDEKLDSAGAYIVKPTTKLEVRRKLKAIGGGDYV